MRASSGERTDSVLLGDGLGSVRASAGERNDPILSGVGQ